MSDQLNTRAMKAAVQSAITRAVNVGLSEVQSTAAALAPVDQGVLRSSATVEPVSWSGDQLSGRVAFPVVYAAVQHERTDYNHPRGGQAKYLSTAVEQHEDRLAQTIQRNVKAALDGSL